MICVVTQQLNAHLDQLAAEDAFDDAVDAIGLDLDVTSKEIELSVDVAIECKNTGLTHHEYWYCDKCDEHDEYRVTFDGVYLELICRRCDERLIVDVDRAIREDIEPSFFEE